MDPKELSPAYLTSLAAILVGAFLIGVSSTLLSVLGWLLLLAGVGLNAFSTLVMVQRLKGGPLPAALTGARPEAAPAEEEASTATAFVEPEPDTEAQQTVPQATVSEEGSVDERIFRSSRAPRPRVR